MKINTENLKNLFELTDREILKIKFEEFTGFDLVVIPKIESHEEEWGVVILQSNSNIFISHPFTSFKVDKETIKDSTTYYLRFGSLTFQTRCSTAEVE